jgi:hypothetical protein
MQIPMEQRDLAEQTISHLMNDMVPGHISSQAFFFFSTLMRSWLVGTGRLGGWFGLVGMHCG